MDVAEAVSQLTLLQELNEDDRRSILPLVELRTVSKRGCLWRDGLQREHFCFLVRGRIKLVTSNELGRETIIDLVLPGDLVCPSVTADGPTCCSAVALEDPTEVVLVPREELLGLMGGHPEIMRQLVRQLTNRTSRLCRRIEEVASGQVERRIGTLLLRLADQAGEEAEDGSTWIPVPISRQDLADMCGTTVETTIRVMSRLAREGVVKTESGGFRILKLDELRQTCRGGQTC